MSINRVESAPTGATKLRFEKNNLASGWEQEQSTDAGVVHAGDFHLPVQALGRQIKDRLPEETVRELQGSDPYAAESLRNDVDRLDHMYAPRRVRETFYGSRDIVESTSFAMRTSDETEIDMIMTRLDEYSPNYKRYVESVYVIEMRNHADGLFDRLMISNDNLRLEPAAGHEMSKEDFISEQNHRVFLAEFRHTERPEAEKSVADADALEKLCQKLYGRSTPPRETTLE